MSFNPTLELTNEMIQFGSQLKHQDYSEYQSMMIEKFYPTFDIDTINQMNEWVKYPTLNLITLDALKDIEIKALEKAFKLKMSTHIVGQDQLNQLNTQIQTIQSCQHFRFSETHQTKVMIFVASASKAISWNNLSNMCLNYHESSFGFLNHSNGVIPSYAIYGSCSFITIIRSIWMHKQDATISTVVDLHDSTIEINEKIAKLQAEINLLKQKNADLSYQVQLTSYSLAVLQPANPVYDYQAIKARKQMLHREFNRLSKLMKLGK